MSALSQIAKDPSCLLTVDALQGGRWLSCLRPGGVQPAAPSGSGTWEERTGLLAFTNITADGGVFRAADEDKSAGIKTPLDFRGNTKSKTFIVRAFCPSHDDRTKNLFLHPFFTQGRWTYGKDYFVFCFGIWEDFREITPTRQLLFAASGDSVAATNSVDASNLLDQWHVFAVSYRMSSSGQEFALYSDGQLLSSGTNSAEVYPWRSNPLSTAETDSEKVYILDNAGDVNYVAGTAISAALVFDRALTASEIAALSCAVV